MTSFLETKLENGFKVYSFYSYEEIEELLKSKYHPLGSFIYALLAKNSLAPFAKSLSIRASLVPIDDRVKNGYAHTAVLVHKMKTKNLQPKYGTLQARNDIIYAGKSRVFRQNNPKDFFYKGAKEDIILVDDIITTGTTMMEAFSIAQKEGATPLFGVTLAKI